MWKNVGAAAGNASNRDFYHLRNLPIGNWMAVRSSQVRQSSDGSWFVNGAAAYLNDIFRPNDAISVAVLHDLNGGWRLLVPHGFKPAASGPTHFEALPVSYVYESIRFSNKVRTIYVAPGRDGLG